MTCMHVSESMPSCVDVPAAGAKERGELENRVTKLIAEIKEAGNVILMWVQTCMSARSISGCQRQLCTAYVTNNDLACA